MAEAASTFKMPGVARVRVQEILLGVAATAVLAGILTFWAWIAISLVQVREDVVRLRSAVERNTEAIARNAEAIARNAEAIARNAEAIARNAESLQRIEALLQAERSGGEAAPRR